MSAPRFFNRTRRSASIPRRLLQRGRLFDIPLYYTLRLSDLAREGIEHSGSWAFADHIYRGEPSGRGPLGRWLDARLLAMPSARSFRNRYLVAADAVARFLTGHPERPLDVLSAPCGIPRELVRGAELAREQAAANGSARDPLDGVTFHGVDLDPDVLERAARCAAAARLPFVPHQGDAFARATYPEAVDFITCTGLGEFLDDDLLAALYAIFYDVLRPRGWFLTSSMRRHWASAYLLEMAELETHYRSGSALEALARRVPFREVTVDSDDVGLQTILTARR